MVDIRLSDAAEYGYVCWIKIADRECRLKLCSFRRSECESDELKIVGSANLI